MKIRDPLVIEPKDVASLIALLEPVRPRRLVSEAEAKAKFEEALARLADAHQELISSIECLTEARREARGPKH